MQLIIPMSGTGQRFIDAGYSDPKPLILVDGRPMIAHVLDLFPGITDVIFICNEDHLANTNMREILVGLCPTGKIVSVAPHKFGPVYAVMQAESLISDEETIVSYCDYGTKWDFEAFLEQVRGFDGALACYKGFHPHMLGSDNYAFCRVGYYIDKNFTEKPYLTDIQEKRPFTDDRMSEFASNGTYYFGKGILKRYFQESLDTNNCLNGEFYVSLVYNLMLRDHLRISVFEIEKMLQWGTPRDLEIYQGWSDFFSAVPAEDDRVYDMTLVMPMAGRGSRFNKLTNVSKPLIPVDGVPMVVKAAQYLPKTTEQVFICQESDYDKLIELFYYYPGSELIPINGITEGQACTCQIGLRDVDPETAILISACDNGVTYDHRRWTELYDGDADVIVWSFRNSQASRNSPDSYSWLATSGEDITNVWCKKFPFDDPMRSHAIIGTMFFRKAKYFTDAFNENVRLNNRTNGEFYVDDVIEPCIAAGLKVKVFEAERYICWGTPEEYQTYNYWSDYFNSRRQ